MHCGTVRTYDNLNLSCQENTSCLLVFLIKVSVPTAKLTSLLYKTYDQPMTEAREAEEVYHTVYTQQDSECTQNAVGLSNCLHSWLLSRIMSVRNCYRTEQLPA